MEQKGKLVVISGFSGAGRKSENAENILQFPDELNF